MNCTHLLVSILGLPALLTAQDAASPRTTLRIAHGDAAALVGDPTAGDEPAALAVGFGWSTDGSPDARSFVAPLRQDVAPSAPQPGAGRAAANLGDAGAPCPVVTVAGVRVACIALAVAAPGGCADWAQVEPPAAALARLWPELARRA